MRGRHDFGERFVTKDESKPGDREPNALVMESPPEPTTESEPDAIDELLAYDEPEAPASPPEDGRLVVLIADDGTEVPARFKKSRRYAHGKWWPNNRWVDNTSGQDMPFQYASWREWPY